MNEEKSIKISNGVNNITLLTAGGVAVLLLGAGIFLGSGKNSPENQQAETGGSAKPLIAKVYYEETCGCCANYIAYLKHSGFAVEEIKVSAMEKIKEDFGLPADLMSCHTAAIGNYTVEGHMPVEVIAKLLEDKPEIKGIALPGMPSGSPGMGGWKEMPWPIYEFGGEGDYQVFMEF